MDISEPLPVDTDLDQIIESGTLAQLGALIRTHDTASSCRRGLAISEGRPDDEPFDLELLGPDFTVGQIRASFSSELERCAPVTALHVLRASEAITRRLTNRRYDVMQAARADGESWSAIGAALGMSKQGAQDWYNKRSIPRDQDHAPAE